MRALPILLLVAGAAFSQDDEAAVAGAELSRRYDDALLRRAARSASASLRRAAARAAGRIRDTHGVAVLLPMLEDGVGPVRRAAIFALGQIGGPTIVLPLRDALPRLDANELAFALEALGKSRDARAASAIAARLQSSNAEVRGAAALACFRLGDPSTVPDLVAALGRERLPEPRWRMIYACWRLLRDRPPPAPPPEWSVRLAACTSPDRPFHERVFATLALGAVGGSGPRLSELLADGDPRVVVAAVRALSKPWDVENARRVVPLLRHEDELLRECALEHLAAGGAAALPLLDEAAGALGSSPRLALRADVARATAGATSLRPPASADAAFNEEWGWRVGPFVGLLPGAAPATPAGRVACAEVCGEERIPRDVALPALLALLDADDFAVRAVAAASLGKRGDASHAAAIAKAAAASRGPAEVDVRTEAARALAALAAHDPWLDRAAVDDPDAAVRAAARAALLALGRAEPPAAAPPGYRLHGLDAAGILAEARGLRGARVRLETSRGRIEMVLYPDEAPAHCVSFAKLVRRGFYDGLAWHRVVADFVIQGGCPRGDGNGGPGYLIPDEIGTRPYVRGTVGMAKSDDDTGGSQLFVTHLPTPHLDGRYTVFGQVVDGFDVVDRIRVGDRIEKAALVEE